MFEIERVFDFEIDGVYIEYEWIDIKTNGDTIRHKKIWLGHNDCPDRLQVDIYEYPDKGRVYWMVFKLDKDDRAYELIADGNMTTDKGRNKLKNTIMKHYSKCAAELDRLMDDIEPCTEWDGC